MKTIFLANILLPFLLLALHGSEMDKMAKLESKKLCSCYKSFEKEKSKSVKEGNINFKFSVKICLTDNRPKKVADYISGLESDKKSVFDQKVMGYMRDCPHVGIKDK